MVNKLLQKWDYLRGCPFQIAGNSRKGIDKREVVGKHKKPDNRQLTGMYKHRINIPYKREINGKACYAGINRHFYSENIVNLRAS